MTGRRYVKLPTQLMIRKYWAEKLDFPWLSFDSKHEFLTERRACFACGMTPPGNLSLDRAHILARNRGGGDGEDNLHCLCRTCHQASEFLDGEKYWEWIEARSPFDMVIELIARKAPVGLRELIQGKLTVKDEMA